MCLRLNKKSKLKVATKNIVVYKVLCKETKYKGFSPYVYAKYEKYNIYTSKIKIENYRNENVIYIGLHSCKSLKAAENHKYIKGSFVNFIVKMIIPKGAYYIIGNEGDEIVSNILIW